jgi:hypothetical protein
VLAVDLKNGEVITMTKDLTKGSPMKLIISFAVPLLFGFLFQQFYNLVDTMIVGRFLGVDDLAAVGSTGSINFLVSAWVSAMDLPSPCPINSVPEIMWACANMWPTVPGWDLPFPSS